MLVYTASTLYRSVLVLQTQTDLLCSAHVDLSIQPGALKGNTS